MSKEKAKDSKKPGKSEKEIFINESKKSLAGIESMVFLLDNSLKSLPFEKL